MKYSVTIPCYNSGKFLSNTIREVVETMDKIAFNDYELILVNDCSPDNTFEVIEENAKKYPQIIGVDLAKNVGQHNAMLTAFRHGSGDYFINMDDDLQTKPADIPKLINKMEETGCDVVYAQFENNNYSFKKRLTSKIHHIVIKWLLDKERDWLATGFWIAKSFVIKEIINYRSEFTDMQSNFIRTTKFIENQKVPHYKREVGQSGYTFKKALKLWSSTMNYTEKPALFLMKFGVGFGIFSLLLLLVLGITRLYIPSLLEVLMCIGIAINLCLFGFIGMFVSRILKVSEGIPHIIIRKTVGNYEKNI